VALNAAEVPGIGFSEVEHPCVLRENDLISKQFNGS